MNDHDVGSKTPQEEGGRAYEKRRRVCGPGLGDPRTCGLNNIFD